MPYNQISRLPTHNLLKDAIRASIGGWLQWTKTSNVRGVRLARLLKKDSLIISRIFLGTLKGRKINSPELAKTLRKDLQSIREILAGQKGEEKG